MAYKTRSGILPAAWAAPTYLDTVLVTVAVGNAWSSQYACGVLAMAVSVAFGGLAFFAAVMAAEIGST